MATKKSAKKRVTFKLDAPQAKAVFVAGTFNDWAPQARPLRSNAKGTWSTWTSLEPGTYEYLFVVDGEWYEDPACSNRCPNPHGSHNSVLKV
jgi:1,4-alpha-glucan branching enzyme